MSSQSPNKKRKYCPSYFRPKNKQYLEVGQRGFLATCNFHEKDCVRECYNILNEYADDLYGKQETVSPLDSEITLSSEDNNESKDNVAEIDDIADELQKEISAATATTTTANKEHNKGTPKRFQVVETGISNCIFVRTTLPEPLELGLRIVNDIAERRVQKSRHLLRLVPIETVCRADMKEIITAGGLLFDKHFLKQSSTFSIVFNKRYNNSISRNDVINELATLVQSKNVGNRVDLKNGEKAVVVEVMKGFCCISVIEGYLQNKRFNLIELATAKEKQKTLTAVNAVEAEETANSAEAEEQILDAVQQNVSNPNTVQTEQIKEK